MQKLLISNIGGIQVSIEVLTWKCIIFRTCVSVVYVKGDTVSKVAHTRVIPKVMSNFFFCM